MSKIYNLSHRRFQVFLTLQCDVESCNKQHAFNNKINEPMSLCNVVTLTERHGQKIISLCLFATPKFYLVYVHNILLA